MMMIYQIISFLAYQIFRICSYILVIIDIQFIILSIKICLYQHSFKLETKLLPNKINLYLSSQNNDLF
jgi:hypothetical protein